MLLLSCTGLSRGFGQGPLFEDLSFELYHGDRVGLVGPNGVGKTTLFRLLAGLDEPDAGFVRLHAGARLALLQQQPAFEPGRSLFDEAQAALDALLTAQAEMQQTAELLARTADEQERARLSARFDRLNELLRRHDAYNVDHHVEAVLDGLGFTAADYERPVETFSGGQLSRLQLAKLLLSAPDVLLLDEPSNHLDIAGTRWLEDYLAGQNEAMLIVSHDRAFLDKVVTKVFELYQRRITVYSGNYTAYVRQRQERYERELKTWEAQQEYIEKQEEYIRRVSYGQLHRQAQSRRAQLDRLKRVERPTRIAGPQLHFRSVRRSGDVVFEAEDLSKGYDGPLFTGLSFQLQRGQRLGIVGPNGSGKTTLLRILLGEEKPDTGAVRRGHLVEVGYYDQHLQSLDPQTEVLRAAWPPNDPDWTEQQMRDLLGRFGLGGDQIAQTVGSLSGGERSRVALARLVACEVNLLVLDEPTNHLDIWAREALESALKAFDGTVIVVSHDRYFLNRVVDTLVVLGDGKGLVVHGNFETFERLHPDWYSRAARSKQREAPAATSRPAKGEAEAKAKVRRKRRFPYRKTADIEADIHEWEERVRECEQRLASPDLYRDGEKVKQVTRTFEEAKSKLAKLYEQWEEAVELNQE